MAVKETIVTQPVLTRTLEKPLEGKGIGVFNNDRISIWVSVEKVGKLKSFVECAIEWSPNRGRTWFESYRFDLGGSVFKQLFTIPTTPGAEMVRIVARGEGTDKNHWVIRASVGWDYES